MRIANYTRTSALSSKKGLSRHIRSFTDAAPGSSESSMNALRSELEVMIALEKNRDKNCQKISWGEAFQTLAKMGDALKRWLKIS
jgi:hypothetical protein